MTDYYRRPRDQPAVYTETVYVGGGDDTRPVARTELVRRVRRDSDEVDEAPRAAPAEVVYRSRAQLHRHRTRSLERGGRDYDDGGYGYAARYEEDPQYDDEREVAYARRKPRRPSRGRSLSRTEELAAAAAGAGLALGTKELWDRRDGGKHRPQSKSRLAQVAVGIAGAAAGDLVAKRAAKELERARRRRGSRDEYDEYESDSDYGRRNRRKSLGKEVGEAALGALGLGAAAGASRHRSRSRDRDGRRRSHRHRSRSSSSSYSSRSPSRRRRGGGDRNKRLQQAAAAAVTAAAAEAWRSRNEPGGFFEGEKARRILTAAAGAGGIDALVDKNPGRHEGRHIGEGAIGGLLLTSLVNGSRDDGSARSRRSRGSRTSRSRSRSVGGTLKNIGAAGLAAGVAKKVLNDRGRSRSRSRRGRRYSSSSSGSRSSHRHRRSKSVSDYIDTGLAKLGLGDRGRASSRPSSRAGSRRGRSASTSSSGSERSDISDLSEARWRRRKMKGKEYLTAGLATVATVNAVSELVETMEKRKRRHQALRDGTLDPKRAKFLKRKALAQDAFAVGLAGLGIKGVVGSWKEMGQQRREVRELERKLAECQARERSRHRSPERGRSAHARGADGSRRQRAASGGRQLVRRASSFSGPSYYDGNPYAALR